MTGHPARSVDTPLDAYCERAYGHVADRPAGYNADPADKSTTSSRENFTGSWNQWKHGAIARDYALLDEIHRGWIRSAEEWLRREEQRGREAGIGGLWERVQPDYLRTHSILKIGEDGQRGRL